MGLPRPPNHLCPHHFALYTFLSGLTKRLYRGILTGVRDVTLPQYLAAGTMPYHFLLLMNAQRGERCSLSSSLYAAVPTEITEEADFWCNTRKVAYTRNAAYTMTHVH